MNLVIVESPAKCQKIQGFLGQGWKVIASMGHIRELEQDLDAIGLDRDFEPKYQYIQNVSKTNALKQMKGYRKDCTEVYLAADDDREGEAIAYAVCQYLKLDPEKTPRAVFHEITEKAVKHAVNNPRRIDMNRVNAQQARAMLDMMIGFTISPLLWRYVGPSLSAGRCQTPALRLIVERENEIQNFRPTSSWKLQGNWQHPNINFKAEMTDELEDEESAMNYLENIHQIETGKITEKNIRDWSESAPLPLITSTLQQQASALYHINPKQTMSIAQRLYEAGHITYMRTDKAVISEEAKSEAKKWITEKYGEEYVSMEQPIEEPQTKKSTTGKKSKKMEESNAQEAHEAIRPTHMEVRDIQGEWSSYDRKIYKLIWQRAIQSVMSPARGEICKIKLKLEEDEFTWQTQWKRTTFEGWKIIGKVAEIDENESENESDTKDTIWDKATALNIGDEVSWKEINAEPKETKAMPRFTEATLVRELEKYSIGRPSTFASLITALQRDGKEYAKITDIPAKEVKIKEYTLKPNQWPASAKELKKKMGAEKSKLVPTDLGRSVLKYAMDNFNDLFEYNFTGQMEKRLDKIAEGNEFWKQVLRDMWGSYKDRYQTMIKAPNTIKTKEGSEESNPRVKEFQGGLKAVISKKGPLLLIEGLKKEDTEFLGWPKGVEFQNMTEELALKFKEENQKKKAGHTMGEWNGLPIVKKTGKFGDYLQCGEVSIPFKSDETLEQTIERFNKKASPEQSNLIKKFKEYEIKNGQYGPYIIKTSLKKIQFVSMPKDINATELSEKDVEALYKAGLEKKKNAKAFMNKRDNK